MSMHSANDLVILTDLYQATMAQGYWDHQRHDRQACFHLFFRKAPFGGSYAIAAGVETALDWLETLRFDNESIAFLQSLRGNDKRPLFAQPFLEYLRTLSFSLAIDSVMEGQVVFPHEPLLRVTGPLLQCQWVESALLNKINFESLIATKASRVCLAAQDSTVVEFGLRRAQGVDGALAASRAAYLGGCHATSNVLAGKLHGIPVRGTHAHSWVMSFDSELEAFQAYATSMPNNCIFLVDTYDTLQGVRNAITVAKDLASRGHRLSGIRLDSGDMTQLSIAARQLLNDAGLTDVSIVASNDLDEFEIERMKKAGAQIDIWGVGTKLVTAYDQPALGGVYKLGAIQDENGVWQDKIKLSEQWIKVSTPGILNVRRFSIGNGPSMDVVFSETMPLPTCADGLDIGTGQQRLSLDRFDTYTDLLQPVMRNSKRLTPPPPLASHRENSTKWRSQFSERVMALRNPTRYPVALETALANRKMQLVQNAKQQPPP